MSVTGQLEVKIHECRETITRLEHDADQATKALQGIERKIQDAQVEVRAFEEALRLVRSEERKPDSDSRPDRSLRPGTKIAKVRDLIREAGRPLHIDEIMDKLGEPSDINARVSIVGSLSKYVKNGQVFKRTATSTFGLKDSPDAEA